MGRIKGKKVGTREEREKRNQMIEVLYENNVSLKKIAELVGLTPTAVGVILRDRGVPAHNEAMSIGGSIGAERRWSKTTKAEETTEVTAEIKRMEVVAGIAAHIESLYNELLAYAIMGARDIDEEH